MLDVGRLCIKTAGRDAMRHCIIIDIIDEKYVLVDGNTRRKKVNKAHLEPLNKIFDIKKNAETKIVFEKLEEAEIKILKSIDKKDKKEKKPQIKKSDLKSKKAKDKKDSKE